MTLRNFSLSKAIRGFFASEAQQSTLHSRSQHPARLGLFNPYTKPHTFFIEPWGADYTLSPHEHFELVAPGYQGEADFEMDTEYEDTQVWWNANSYEVLQDGNVVECGHNRQLTTLFSSSPVTDQTIR